MNREEFERRVEALKIGVQKYLKGYHAYPDRNNKMPGDKDYDNPLLAPPDENGLYAHEVGYSHPEIDPVANLERIELRVARKEVQEDINRQLGYR